MKLDARAREGDSAALARVSRPPASLEPPPSVQPRATLSRRLLLLLAFACGLAVANVYFAQPLLDTLATEFGIDRATIGILGTVTQLGYGTGLLFLVPLGDLLDRRRLVAGKLALSSLALLAVGLAPVKAVLMTGLVLVGLLAVVTQVLVAYAATLATPSERGSAVGTVTSGIVLGILMARTVSGFLADVAGWRAVYLLSSAVTLSTAIALFRALPKSDGARVALSYRGLLASMFTLFAEERRLRVHAGLGLLIFATFSVFWTSLVLPLTAAPLSLSHTEVGAFGLVGVAGAVAASRAGRLADRGYGRPMLGFALGLMLLSWLPIALLSRSLVWLVAGVLVLDLAVQAVHVTNQTLLFAVRPEARSRLAAGYMIFYSIGSGLGAIASTAMYAAYGWTGVCALGAAISAVALAFFALTREPKRA